MSSKRKKHPPPPDKPVGVWALVPHEKVHGVITGTDNPMMLRLSEAATLTLWVRLNTPLSPGKVVTIPMGSTIAIYVAGDLRSLLECVGMRVFIRCGRRVVRDGAIVYQRFDSARKAFGALPVAPPSSEDTDAIADSVGGYASVHD